MIYFKDNVRIKELNHATIYVFNILYNMNSEQIPDYPKDWLITSVNDSVHNKNSKHYKNFAWDMRSKNFKSNNVKIQFAHQLEARLGEAKFTVLLEDVGTDNEHFHIQVQKGEVFP